MIAANFFASKIGKTLKCDFAAGAASRYQLLTIVQMPVLFILKATQRCYFRHGGATVTADTLDFEMDADKEYPLLVERLGEAYISCYGITALGYVKATQTSQNFFEASEDPATV